MSNIFPITSNMDFYNFVIDEIQITETPTLYLYHMSQDSRSESDNVISCVVCAACQKDALDINPLGENDPKWEIWEGADSIKLIGKALGLKEGEVICSSFHLLLN